MSNPIHIPKPCAADWSKMAPTERGRFCSICSKTVVDFTGNTLKEINTYHQNAQQEVCGNYLERHTRAGNGWYRFLNTTESLFSRGVFRKPVLLGISLLLLLSACHRHVRGRMKAQPAKKTAQVVKGK